MVAIVWFILWAGLFLPAEALAPRRSPAQRLQMRGQHAAELSETEEDALITKSQTFDRPGYNNGEDRLVSDLFKLKQTKDVEDNDEVLSNQVVSRFYQPKTKQQHHQRSHQHQYQKMQHHHRRKGRRKFRKTGTGSRRRHHHQKPVKMRCMSKTKSVWLRNDCLDGYVSVLTDRRVAAIHKGINQNDNLGNPFNFTSFFILLIFLVGNSNLTYSVSLHLVKIQNFTLETSTVLLSCHI